MRGSPDPAIQSDNFSTQYTGKVHVDTAGTYTFVSNTDDDGFLFLRYVRVAQSG